MGFKLQLERRNVWDFIWDQNDPESFVDMEESRINVFKHFNWTKKASFHGNLCSMQVNNEILFCISIKSIFCFLYRMMKSNLF